MESAAMNPVDVSSEDLPAETTSDHGNSKQPTPLKFVLSDQLEFLNAEHWDELTAGSTVFLSRDYLEAFRVAGPECQLRYVLIYRDAIPVACVATQTFDIDGTQLVHSVEHLSEEDKAQLAIKKLTRKALGTIHRRVTICGNVISWGPHGVAIREGEDSSQIWTAVSEALYRLRRGDKLYGSTDYVMVKDLPQTLADESEVLGEFGYRRIETEPDMVLEVPESWTGIDDYLADLNRKYRKAARGVLKSMDNADVEIAQLEGDDVERAAWRLHELYAEVASRASIRLASLSDRFFPELAKRMGPERFAVVTAKQDERIIGFVTVIRDGETAVGYYLGVDYEANADLPVYHRLLFAVIEQAMRWGCRQISFGRTALDAKARLGCVAHPTYIWVRHRVPILNLAVRQILRTVPHAEPPERNPFRSLETG